MHWAKKTKSAVLQTMILISSSRDNFIAMSKEMNDMYRSAMSDSTLTDEQRENVMKEIEKKDSIAMDVVFNTIEANITNAVGIQLLLLMLPHSNWTNKNL
ncbi:MAG: hypothetical protein ACLUVG_14460 [Phocaeicola vulgatus]